MIKELVSEPISFLAGLASCLWVEWDPGSCNAEDIAAIIHNLYIMIKLTLVECSSRCARHLAKHAT